MGCHTWFYRKEELDIEEARKLYIDRLEKFINDWKRMIDNSKDECRVAYKWTQEYMEHSLAIFERQLRMVKKGLCNVAVMNKQEGVCKYIPEKGFYTDTTKRPVPLKTEYGSEVEYYHDLFRINPKIIDENTIIHSEEECMKFLKDNNITEVEWDDLKEFWSVYPDGIICFG